MRAALHDCIAEAARGAVSRLAPRSGVMLQAVWFDAGPQAAGRLLLTIHHLAVDGVSWRILVPDLAAAWAAIAARRCACAAAAGHLVAALVATADRSGNRCGTRCRSLASGSAMLSAPSLSLIDGALDEDRDVAGSAGHLTMTLPASVTGALLTQCAGGVSCRHQRGAADRARGGDCPMGPAARTKTAAMRF